VANRNKTFKIKDVLKLADEAMAEVTADEWKECIKHVIKLEQLFMDKEKLTDDFFEQVAPPFQIVINLNDDSSSSSEDSLSTDEEESLQEQATRLTPAGFPLIDSSSDED